MTINSKSTGGYDSKSTFFKETAKAEYEEVNNAYDLNRTGRYCERKVESHRE